MLETCDCKTGSLDNKCEALLKKQTVIKAQIVTLLGKGNICKLTGLVPKSLMGVDQKNVLFTFFSGKQAMLRSMYIFSYFLKTEVTDFTGENVFSLFMENCECLVGQYRCC